MGSGLCAHVETLSRSLSITSVDNVVVLLQLLSDDVAKGSDESGNSGRNQTNWEQTNKLVSRDYLTSCLPLIGPGKELVHYMATPLQTPELNLLGGGEADMPSLLELDEEPFFTTDLPEEDPTTALLTTSQPQSDLWHSRGGRGHCE